MTAYRCLLMRHPLPCWDGPPFLILEIRTERRPGSMTMRQSYNTCEPVLRAMAISAN
jgi:hypothetical protein